VIGAATYKWDFGDGFTSNDQTPIHYYNKPGKYAVKMYAYSVQGCELIEEKPDYIKVEDNAVPIVKPQPSTKAALDSIPYRDNLVFPNPIVTGSTNIRFLNSSSKTEKGTLEIFTISGIRLLKKAYDVPPGSMTFLLDDLSVMSAKTYYIFMISINDKKFPFKILML
jgi:PKD repeat protein